MFRKEKHISKTTHLLAAGLLCLLMVISVLGGENAKNKCGPAFNYPDAKEDVKDLSFYKPSSETKPYPIIRDSNVKNIIFCIGDGMGLG